MPLVLFGNCLGALVLSDTLNEMTLLIQAKREVGSESSGPEANGEAPTVVAFALTDTITGL